MSLAGQASAGVAPSGISGHEGVVLGLLALIVLIRLVESTRLPAAWTAVFGSGTGSVTVPASTKPAPASPSTGPTSNPAGFN